MRCLKHSEVTKNILEIKEDLIYFLKNYLSIFFFIMLSPVIVGYFVLLLILIEGRC